jgi:hypothetical protein
MDTSIRACEGVCVCLCVALAMVSSCVMIIGDVTEPLEWDVVVVLVLLSAVGSLPLLGPIQNVLSPSLSPPPSPVAAAALSVRLSLP